MKIIAQNRRASHDYEILDKFEAGIVLYGSEVKSIRGGKVNLADSYAKFIDGELFIFNLHINTYSHAGMDKPEETRKRKLLLNKREIFYLQKETERKQLTIIPLSMYFKKKWIKVEIALCRGRKKWDKREKIAEKEYRRDLRRVGKRSGFL
ncbi:MAG: SsrA-binding protein SmpB [Chitinispirillaceae bacterium]|nr:SsrA-binding protein SmpB [Chitinispirillaceae bacterium]